MQIVINDEPKSLDGPRTVAELIGQLKLVPQRVAIEINGQLVRRAEYAQTVLREGDRVEVVTLVGGG